MAVWSQCNLVNGQFGGFFLYWVDYACLKTLDGQDVWRFPIAFQSVFVIISGGTIFFLPESPRWLYAHGHKEQAGCSGTFSSKLCNNMEVFARLVDARRILGKY
jgi:Sugar (and other) transporter